MKFGVLVSAVAAVLLLSAAGASAQRGGMDVVGEWTARGDGVGMGTCKVTLTDKDWFGGWQASSFGCSGKLFGIGKWKVQGSDLVLLGIGDKEAARLRQRGGVLTGTDGDGKALTLSRGSAPPSLPSARRDDGPRPGPGREFDLDRCVRYGDSDRCASRADMAPPQVRMLTLGNVRDRPSFQGTTVLGTAPRGTCAAVRECVTEQGTTWCRVQWEGPNGWVAQTAPDRGDPNARILLFKSGCD